MALKSGAVPALLALLAAGCHVEKLGVAALQPLHVLLHNNPRGMQQAESGLAKQLPLLCALSDHLYERVSDAAKGFEQYLEEHHLIPAPAAIADAVRLSSVATSAVA